MKEDEYLRDGITEDITTELSKIKGLKTFSRPMVLAYRDKPVTAGQIGKELGAAYVLSEASGAPAPGSESMRNSSMRRRTFRSGPSGMTARCRMSSRYRTRSRRRSHPRFASRSRRRSSRRSRRSRPKICRPTIFFSAAATMRGAWAGRTSCLRCRCTRTPCRSTRTSLSLTPEWSLISAQYYYFFERQQKWIDRAIAATKMASATGSNDPEIHAAEAWLSFAEGRYEEAIEKIRGALKRKPDLDGGYYLLGRSLFSSGQYQEVATYWRRRSPIPERTTTSRCRFTTPSARSARRKR